jgi:phosphatidylglycerol lysyltransferase
MLPNTNTNFREQHPREGEVPPEPMPYIQQWGSQSLAYSCVQPDLHYFNLPGIGLLPYRQSMRTTLALGNPLCAPEHEAKFLRAFLAQHPRALFAQVEGRTAATLRSLNLHLTPIGTDALIDIPSFTLRGKSKRDLRHYQNVAAREKTLIQELPDTPANRFELHQLSKIWIRQQKVSTRELSFLIRPFAPHPEPGTRLFTATTGSQTLGFVIFDPIHQRGTCTGYTASILRALPNAPEGTLDTIILSAIDQFKKEGLQTLSLGVMPMHAMPETAQEFGRGARPLYHLSRALNRLPWKPICNTTGLSFHKMRYRPHLRPVFIATTSPIGLQQMTALTLTCGLLP